ncbi:MAG: hypothetical protein JSS43_02340 [Proteobacteria bacterium]|nr:hypothetical protein [Pseudomonadota bacterium]
MVRKLPYHAAHHAYTRKFKPVDSAFYYRYHNLYEPHSAYTQPVRELFSSKPQNRLSQLDIGRATSGTPVLPGVAAPNSVVFLKHGRNKPWTSPILPLAVLVPVQALDNVTNLHRPWLYEISLMVLIPQDIARHKPSVVSA